MAVLGGSLDLLQRNFLGKLAEVRLGDAGYLYLYDRNRTLIIHPDRSRVLQRDVPAGVNRLFDAALEDFEGTGETTTSRGLEALSSFKRLTSTDWILAANFPVAEAYAPLQRAKAYFALGLIVLLLLASLVVWSLMKYLTAPLLALTDHVRKFGEGNEEPVPMPPPVLDEIGILGQVFNRMAQRIADKRDALRRQLQFLQVLLDSIPAPIFYKDADGKYLGCNKSFEGYIGISQEDLAGKSVFDLAPRDLAEVYHRADAELFNQGPNATQVYEAAVKYADGSLREVIFFKANFPDSLGSLGGMVGTILDISERKRTEKELQQTFSQLRKLSQAVEQSPNAVVVTDIHGAIEYVNPRFTEVTGYSAEEATGKNPRILKGGDTPDEYYRTLWETITAGREWRGEFRNQRKDGGIFWENALISPLKDVDGAITHFIAVKENITEKKLAAQRQLLTSQILSILELPSDRTDKIREILLLSRITPALRPSESASGRTEISRFTRRSVSAMPSSRPRVTCKPAKKSWEGVSAAGFCSDRPDRTNPGSPRRAAS